MGTTQTLFEPDAILMSTPKEDGAPDFEVRKGLSILCVNDRIEQIGPKDTLNLGSETTQIRLPNRILVPGTVNAHNHSFQSLLRGVADDRPFLVWRDEALYKYAPHLGTEGIYTGALLAFAEMALMGVTTVCDFFYVHGAGIETDLAVRRAAEDVGIRLVLARTFYDWDGAPECFRESPAEALKNFESLLAEFKDDPFASALPAPHSPHGASDEMIQIAVDAAKRHDLPWHLHLAEEPFELEEIFERTGKTPVDFLESIGCVDERMCIVHGVHLPQGDIEKLGAVQAGLLHCPSSNMFLGDGAAPLVKMLEAGMQPALGSDGGCSNNRVSVFEEMRMASLLQKVIAQDGGAFDAQRAFDLGTRGGAKLCNLDAGQLEPGLLADFVAIDLDDLSLYPDVHLLRSIVYALQPTAITDVFVGAKATVRNRRLARVQEGEVRARVVETSKAIGLRAV